jgi:type IV pilus assembly protein PilX
MAMRPVPDLLRTQYAQRGTALVMALVFLLLMTMLAITAINTSTLEERMAGNTKDQNLAFQAAETALRAGELWVDSRTLPTQLTAPSTAPFFGIYNPSTTGTEIWDTVDWNDTTNAVKSYSTTPLTDVSTPPKYIIEVLSIGPATPPATNTYIVRITARGTGASNSTVSMVQSTYRKVF